MTITEKVAYLKGLMEGLGVDESTKEGKVLKAVLDILDDMALSIEDLDAGIDELSEMVDAIDEDLGAVEDDLYEDEDDEDDDEEYEDEDEELELDEDDELYEVTCPTCNLTFTITEEMLDAGETKCPECGQALEFDLDIGEDEE